VPKTAIVVANGELPPSRLVKKVVRKASLLVCANGGAVKALRLGLQPDVVIGDLDSLPPRWQQRLEHAAVIRSSNQDRTDLEKALLYLLRQKVKRIVIFGATGKRIDQTVANLSLLEKYQGRAHLTFIDPSGTVEIVRSSAKFRASPGETVSLLPIGRVEGVTTKGLLYPLVNETLEPGTRGVSNEVTGRSVEIRVRRGKLLLVKLFRR
jgi:thiamine pyrophosphokinase